MVLKPASKKSLEQLAERYSVTQIAMVERLIDQADSPAPTPAIHDGYREHRIDAQTSLSETALQKLERFKKKESELLAEMWREQLDDEKRKLRKEFEASLPERIAELEKQEQRLTREIKKYQMMRDGIGLFMTEEEYKLVKGVCHPDREADSERKAKAFHVMQRMEEYFATLKASLVTLTKPPV